MHPFPDNLAVFNKYNMDNLLLDLQDAGALPHVASPDTATAESSQSKDAPADKSKDEKKPAAESKGKEALVAESKDEGKPAAPTRKVAFAPTTSTPKKGTSIYKKKKIEPEKEKTKAAPQEDYYSSSEGGRYFGAETPGD